MHKVLYLHHYYPLSYMSEEQRQMLNNSLIHNIKQRKGLNNRNENPLCMYISIYTYMAHLYVDIHVLSLDSTIIKGGFWMSWVEELFYDKTIPNASILDGIPKLYLKLNFKF